MSIDDQFATAAEAYRRSTPDGELPAGSPPACAASVAPAPSPFRGSDTWSSGGMMPGVITPDLQGPEPPLGGSDVSPVAENFGEGNFNMADILLNPHGWRS